MKPTLQLRLSQHLALTPQLQQSIRLLQLSTLELNQEIEQALSDNPLLERVDDPLDGDLRIMADGSLMSSTPISSGITDPASMQPSSSSSSSSSSSDGQGDDGDRDSSDRDSYDRDGGDGFDEGWGFEDFGRGARNDEDDEREQPQIAHPGISLHDHLMAQLGATMLTPRDRGFVHLLIEHLDDNGLLTCELQELFDILPAELDAEFEELTAALRLLQSFDPSGVGARSAGECLALQLAALPDQSVPVWQRTLALHIVREHLALLAANDFVRLRRVTGASEDQLREARALIRRLNPHPGGSFGGSDTGVVIPDVLVRRLQGQWSAVLNPEVVPKLRLNDLYAQILKKHRGGSLSQQLQEARWLIRNVQQRFDTILRVSQAIVDRQRAFFTHGEVAMRPLVLREIAEQCNLHESTVSRVTTQKFMLTPFGTFELKYFFGSHVATDTGGAASSTAIRALIKQLIGAEDPKKPLSDSQIADMLGKQGIMVARRTVAKYREALKIAPVSLRKSL